jgi:two-component system OmpR family response regulator
VLLDLNLPDGRGSTLRALRRQGNAAPVIILTAQTDRLADRRLNSGADDYPVKPFDLSEPAARWRSRRGMAATPIRC